MHKFYILLSICFLLFGCKKDSINPLIPEDLTIEVLNDIIFPSVDYSSDSYGKNQSLDTPFYIYFSKQINIERNYYLANGDKRLLRCILSDLMVEESDGEILQDINFSLNENNDTIQVNIQNLLDAESSYIIKTEYTYEVKNNDSWEPIYFNESKAITSLTHSFTSASLADEVIYTENGYLDCINNISLHNNMWPKINFNYPINETLYVTTDNKTKHTIRIICNKVEITQNSSLLTTELIWDSPTQLRLYSDNDFLPLVDYTLSISMGYEELINGEWTTFEYNNSPIIESKTFTYQIATKDLFKGYIEYSYPLERQFNFYKGEYNKGYLQFIKDPSEINVVDISDLQFKFSVLPENTEIKTLQGEYNKEDQTIWFDIPEELLNEHLYRLEFISGGNSIYQNEFRVSKYNKLEEKFPNNMTISGLLEKDPIFSPSLNNHISIRMLQTSFSTNTETDEYFDYYETTKLTESNDRVSLIKITAQLDEWDWYQSSIYKYIYDNYPVIPEAKVTRDTSLDGIPPSHYFSLFQTNYNRLVSDDEIASGIINYTTEYCIFEISLSQFWAQDFDDTYVALREKYSSLDEITNERLKEIYDPYSYPAPLTGNYPVTIEYVLPGKNIITSSFNIDIRNNF